MSEASITINRSCENCSKCCEGWLEAEIYGKKAFPGQPCFFIGASCKGCTIYDQRPSNPCKEYSCAWLDEPETFPNWMKPSESNVLITKMVSPDGDEEHTVYQVIETGKVIDSSILNWLIHWSLQKNINLMYQVNGKFHTMLTQKTKNKLSESQKSV